MKLLKRILSNQNMNEAYLRVYKNKGASGVDGVTVDELKQYLKEHKDELRQRIRTRKYQPQAALRVEIPKENGKMRKLGIPTVVWIGSFNKPFIKYSVRYLKSSSVNSVTVLDRKEVVRWPL